MRQPVDAAFDPKPVARLDMVRLAAEPEPDLSGLFGRKVALLPPTISNRASAAGGFRFGMPQIYKAVV